jgi:hypothetical protein
MHFDNTVEKDSATR